MRGHGAAVGTVIGVGFVLANVVAVVATVAWVSSGSGLLTAGGLARSTVTTILVATLLGAAVAGLLARRLLSSMTGTARVATAAGAAAYAITTGLLLVFGGEFATGLVAVAGGLVTAAATAILVVRPPAHPRT